MDVRDRLASLAAERIVILDGAWGVLLQGRGLSEEEFRGERFADHARDVKGDPDLLNLTQPDIVAEIHRQYLEAGADITTTNTFTATSIGQGDYGLQDAVYDMNVEGARLARTAADAFGDRFVAGSVGPLNVTLSLSPKVEDPAFRSTSFEQVYEAYVEQIEGLARRGGRSAADRDDLRHPEREGGDRRREGHRARAPLVDLGHDRRPERTHALGPDGRGLLDGDRACRPADRGRQLLPRRPGDASLRRGRWHASRRSRSRATRTPVSPTRSADTTRRPRRPARSSGSSRGTASSTSSAAAAAPRPTTSG